MRLKEREEDDKLEQLKTCDEVAKAGMFGYIGSALLGIGGALITPVCPVAGPIMVNAAVAGWVGSTATSVGAGVASHIISNS